MTDPVYIATPLGPPARGTPPEPHDPRTAASVGVPFAIMPLLEEPEAQPKVDYHWFDQLADGMRLHNPVSAWFDEMSTPRPSFHKVPGYTAFRDPQVTGDYIDVLGVFDESQSPEETAWLINRVNTERRWREVAGLGGEIAGALSNPLLYMGAAGAARAGLGIAGTALTEGGIEALSEAQLQQLQQIRSWQESTVNIAAATLLPVVFGGAFAALSSGQVGRFERALADDLRTTMGMGEADVGRTGPGSLSAAEAVDVTADELGIAGGTAQKWFSAVFGEQKGREWAQWLNEFNAVGPAQRALQSASVTARKLATQMADIPFVQKMQLEGETIGPSVEAMIRPYTGMYALAQEAHDRIFKQYRGAGGTLSKDDFAAAVTSAMRRGDIDPDPHVVKAAHAWRRPLDEVKRRAIEVGVLPEDVATKYAKGYVPRKYRIKDPLIEAKLANLLERWFAQSGDPAEAAWAAEQAVQKMRQGGSDIPGYISLTPDASGTKARTLPVPDEILEAEGVLDNDIRRLSRTHILEMARDIEMSRMFGYQDRHLGQLFKQVDEEYAELIREAADAGKAKTAAKLARERRKTRSVLTGMRDRIYRTEGRPNDPENWLHGAEKGLRAWNMTTMMGGAGLSSIPEFARPIMAYGMRGMAKSFSRFASSKALKDLSKRELKLAGSAVENVMNSRVAAFSDMATDLDSGWSGRFTRGMAKISGLTDITNVQQDIAGHLAMDGILTAAQKVASGGRGAKAAMVRLAKVGIDERTARKIAELQQVHGHRMGALQVPNTENWLEVRPAEEIVESAAGIEVRTTIAPEEVLNRDVVDKFRAAVSIEVRRVITEPGIGDTPLWFTATGLGRLLTQFKSFMIGAHNRYLVRGLLQEGDFTIVAGLITMIGLGHLRETVGVYAAGKDPSDFSPEDQVLGGIERSGVAGVYGLMLQMGRAAMGEHPSRYIDQQIESILLGPSGATADYISQAGSAALTGDLRPWDNRWLRLVPYNDVLKARKLLESGEVLPPSRPNQ